MTESAVGIVKSIFESLKGEFPNLFMEIDESPRYTEIEIMIAEQKGLDFGIQLDLQNTNELHLHVDDFWGEWFPCTEYNVADNFLQATRGLLSGTYRIAVYSRNGKPFKRLLQSPENGSWKTKYTHTSVHWSCFSPQVRYVQNGHT
jgi:hypothetical protein